MGDYNNVISRLNAQALESEDLMNEIFQGVISGSVVLSMAKRLRDMTKKELRLRILDDLVTAYFVDETGLIKTTKAAWTDKYVYAEKIAAIIPVPKEVLLDSDYDIFAEIKPQLIEAFHSVIDGAILFGTNAPSSWPTNIVAGATAASNTVSCNSSDNLVDKIGSTGGLMAKVEDSGYEVTGFISPVSMKARLRGLKETTGGLIYQPALTSETPNLLYGLPARYMKNGAFDTTKAQMIAGAFNEAVYSIRKDLDFEVLKEASIHDATGALMFNLAQQDMVALKATMRLGWQLPNPVNRQMPDDEDRYPFAIITPAVS